LDVDNLKTSVQSVHSNCNLSYHSSARRSEAKGPSFDTNTSADKLKKRSIPKSHFRDRVGLGPTLPLRIRSQQDEAWLLSSPQYTSCFEYTNLDTLIQREKRRMARGVYKCYWRSAKAGRK
jgi:hypothetical protein